MVTAHQENPATRQSDDAGTLYLPCFVMNTKNEIYVTP